MRTTIRSLAAFNLVSAAWYAFALLFTGGVIEGEIAIFRYYYVICLSAGIYSGIQLWRFKPSGRIASLVLFSYAALFHFHYLLFPTPTTSILSVATLGAINLLCTLTLLTSSAKKICNRDPSIQ